MVVVLVSVGVGGAFPGLVFSVLGMHLFLQGVNIEFSLGQWGAFALVFLSVPLSAYLVGAVFDSPVPATQRSRNLRKLLVVGAVLFAVTSSEMLRYFVDYVVLVHQSESTVKLIELMAVAGTGVSFVVMVLTVAAGYVVCMVEVPLRWIGSSGRIPIAFPYSSCRELVLVACILLAWNFAAGMIDSELSPLSIVGRLK